MRFGRGELWRISNYELKSWKTLPWSKIISILDKLEKKVESILSQLVFIAFRTFYDHYILLVEVVMCW
jgi:hypothetical protein